MAALAEALALDTMAEVLAATGVVAEVLAATGVVAEVLLVLAHMNLIHS